MSGKSAPRVLILGNGTGTFARQCRAYFPGAQVEGVEIDGKITRLASEYFDLPAEVGITEYDGRAYLQAIEGEYDVIMVDAYQDITIPFQMSTVEFFTQVREHLAENGVMVVNMNMHASGENSINVWLNDTICSVFSNVCEVEVPYSTNKEVFASDGDGALTDRLQNGIYGLEDAQLGALLERVSENLKPSAGGSRLLTDDRAPVEMLGMTMIDSLIRDEVRDYKKIYETEGLSGLLKRLR